jgi:WD40 repeat protein
MASLFISHSSHDRDEAERIAQRLQVEGFAALFLDFDPADGIPAGRDWERELYAQLRKTDGVVFLASAASVASQWCFAEVSHARSLGRPIFPLRLEAGVRLGLLDGVQWIELSEGEIAFARLFAGLRRAGLDPADSFTWDPTRSPYPGLQSFSVDDAAVFFGRNQEIDRLMELLQPTLQRGAGRFVAVVGPSGSGKSSLLRAGLLPRLERLHLRWVVLPALVPGQQPTRNLAYCVAAAFVARGQQRPVEDVAEALGRGGAGLVELAVELSHLAGIAAGGAGDGRTNVLVVIDQAEELLTRTGVREQQAFLTLVREALVDDSPVWVVATMRSEFLSTAPERAGLAEIVDDSLIVEPLSRSRLPIVIQQPAQRAGLQFAAGLVEQMVEETTGGDALPLLAYMLRELYQQAGADGIFTVAEYHELGGVIGAIQSRADRLTDELARRGHEELVLPTLTKFAVVEGDAEPTSRRIPRSALGPDEQAVVDAFVEARLLTSSVDPEGETVVGVAHEALLRQWPPLRDAIEASRASLRMRSELERLASDWDQGRRDESYLLRGGRLSAFEEWAAGHGSDVEPLERQFIEASKTLASKQLEATRRSNRRLRALAFSLMVLVLAVGLVAFIAIRANQTAIQARDNASQQRDIAVSRQLITESEDLSTIDPVTAKLKSLAAWRIHPSDDAWQAILSAASLSGIAVMTAHTNIVISVAFSPDGKTLATGSFDGSVRLWDLATRRPIGSPLTRNEYGVNSVAFSPDGKTLASGGWDKSVTLWNVASHRQLGRPLTGHTDVVNSVAFSPDGKTLASGSDDKSMRLWDVASHRQLGRPLTGHTDSVFSVAFSPDGKTLVSGSDDKSVRLWDVASHGLVGSPLTGHIAAISSVAFSPDGKTLASSSDDKSVRLWDVASHRLAGSPLTGHTAGSAAFSWDGTTLATGSEDKSVRLWDVASHRLVGSPLTENTDAVISVAFSPDGKTLAAGSFDGSMRLWEVASHRPVGPPLTGRTGAVISVAFSPDGKTLASLSASASVRLWDVASRRLLGDLLTDDTGAVFREQYGGGPGLAFSPDGKTLASLSWDDSVRLWDVASHRQLGRPLTGHTDAVYSVAFSPDGKALASSSFDNSVRLWDVASHRQLGRPLTGHTDVVTSVAFGPDGKTLASSSWDGSVRIWDVASHGLVSAPLTAHKGAFSSVAFSPDGKTLASSDEKSVQLWNIPQLDEVSLICKSVGQSFTRDQWQSIVPPGPEYRTLCP